MWMLYPYLTHSSSDAIKQEKNGLQHQLCEEIDSKNIYFKKV